MKNKIILYFIVVLMIFFSVGCGKSNSNAKVVKKYSKEEISKIEKDYLGSENILKIASANDISDKGKVIVGVVDKGVFSLNDIVEYIDIYGNLKKASVVGVELFQKQDKTAVKDDEPALLLQGNKVFINNSSILFKRKDYNGISVYLNTDQDQINKVKDYLDKSDHINVEVDDKKYNAELVSFSVNDEGKNISVSLILDDNISVVEKKIKFLDINLDGYIVNKLK